MIGNLGEGGTAMNFSLLDMEPTRVDAIKPKHRQYGWKAAS
jgi:hypothetical protein